MKVSVIVTAYNYGKYIERCIRSLKDQNFPANAYEIIVIDDCSTDETPEVMKNYANDPAIKYCRTPENMGVAGAANMGIRQARGQYVIRVDADDYVTSNFLFFLSEYLSANHDAFCVSCDYFYVNEMEEKIERLYAAEKPVSCGIMYRKDLLIRYGMYNDDWRHREEEELRKRLGSKYNLHHLRMPLYRYRMHKSNKTKQVDMMEEFKQRLEQVKISESLVINKETEEKVPHELLAENVAVVIPARGGSTRLPRKNIYPLWGKPLLFWAIQAAKKSRYVKQIVVSTEDREIAGLAKSFGAKVIIRPDSLSGSDVYKHDVICHAVRSLEEEGILPSLVISLQPNSPEVLPEQLDAGIEHLLKYKKQEVMSVDQDLNQNAAFRVMTRNAVFQKTLSTNFGVVIADLTDVHTLEDIKVLEKKGANK